MRGRRREPAGRAHGKGKRHAVDGALGLGNLGGTHHLEVGGLQQFGVRTRHRHVDFDGFIISRLRLRGLVRTQRLVDAPRGGLVIRVAFRFTGQRRQQQVTHLFHQPRVAPENVKGLVEDQPVLRLLHQAARQGVVEFDTVADIDSPARLDAIQRRRRTQPQPGATQRTHEMRDILVELLAPMPAG